jgi:hypothetical protein
MKGSVAAYVRANKHTLGFLDGQRSSNRAPHQAEERLVLLSPAHRPISAVDIASDPEFLEWAGEERAAELAVLTVRAHR